MVANRDHLVGLKFSRRLPYALVLAIHQHSHHSSNTYANTIPGDP